MGSGRAPQLRGSPPAAAGSLPDSPSAPALGARGAVTGPPVTTAPSPPTARSPGRARCPANPAAEPAPRAGAPPQLHRRRGGQGFSGGGGGAGERLLCRRAAPGAGGARGGCAGSCRPRAPGRRRAPALSPPALPGRRGAGRGWGGAAGAPAAAAASMSSSRAKKVKMATKSCPECDQQVRRRPGPLPSRAAPAGEGGSVAAGLERRPPRAGGAARPASRRPASRGWLAGPQAGGRPGAGGLAGHLGEDRLLLSLGLWPKGGTGDRGWNGGRWASAPAGGPWLSVASGRSAAVGGGAAGAAPSAQLWRSPPRATVPLRQHLGDERHCRPRFGSSLGTVGVRCAALTFRRAGRGSGAAGSRPPPPGAPGCVPCPGRPAAPRVSARSLASCFFSSACRLWLLLDTHRCRLCACDIDARRCRLSCLVLRQEKNQAGSALLRSSADVK